MLNEEKILKFLKNIETGEVKLTPRDEPQEVFAGTVEYDADNNWSLGIFNDANEWDYIEWVRSNTGEFIQFKDFGQELSDYEPPGEVAWKMYGIPGYMKFRCKLCYKTIKKNTNLYICSKCKNQNV